MACPFAGEGPEAKVASKYRCAISAATHYGTPALKALSQQIAELGVLAQIGGHERAAAFHLEPLRAHPFERAAHQGRTEPAATQCVRNFRVRDDDAPGRRAVNGNGDLPLDLELEPARRRVVAHLAHACLVPLMARHTRSGVAGMSMWCTPNGESASITALATAGMAPTAPASPAPLTPGGLVAVGTGLLSVAIAGRSPARGMA